MNVLRVQKEEISRLEKEIWEKHYINLFKFSPTPLPSAFNALILSKALRKDKIEIVEVYNQKDALTAISALKLNESDSTIKIVYIAKPNSETPRRIFEDVRRHVDGWVLSTERLNTLYIEKLKNRTIIKPAAITTEKFTKPDFSGTITLAWIGEIKNTERLKKAIEIIYNNEYDVKLIICGAGKARDVMPLVRLTREIDTMHRIIWKGEDYNKAECIELCHAAVRTADDITTLEYEILQSGRKVIEPDEINDFLAEPNAAEEETVISGEKYIETLANYLYEIRNQ